MVALYLVPIDHRPEESNVAGDENLRRRFHLTCHGLLTTMPPNKTKEKQMNNYIRVIAAALCLSMTVLLAPPSPAQGKSAKLEAISQQLNLTPEQKAKILPILAAEGPKVQKIKNDNSLSKFQKIEQIKAIHQLLTRATAQFRTALARRSKYLRCRSSVLTLAGPRSNSTFSIVPLKYVGNTLAYRSFGTTGRPLSVPMSIPS